MLSASQPNQHGTVGVWVQRGRNQEAAWSKIRTETPLRYFERRRIDLLWS